MKKKTEVWKLRLIFQASLLALWACTPARHSSEQPRVQKLHAGSGLIQPHFSPGSELRPASDLEAAFILERPIWAQADCAGLLSDSHFFDPARFSFPRIIAGLD